MVTKKNVLACERLIKKYRRCVKKFEGMKDKHTPFQDYIPFQDYTIGDDIMYKETGFGTYSSCTLCKAVPRRKENKLLPDCRKCIHSILFYDSYVLDAVTFFCSAENLLKGDDAKNTYRAIALSKCYTQLISGIKSRILYLEILLEIYYTRKEKKKGGE